MKLLNIALGVLALAVTSVADTPTGPPDVPRTNPGFWTRTTSTTLSSPTSSLSCASGSAITTVIQVDPSCNWPVPPATRMSWDLSCTTSVTSTVVCETTSHDNSLPSRTIRRVVEHLKATSVPLGHGPVVMSTPTTLHTVKVREPTTSDGHITIDPIEQRIEPSSSTSASDRITIDPIEQPSTSTTHGFMTIQTWIDPLPQPQPPTVPRKSTVTHDISVPIVWPTSTDGFMTIQTISPHLQPHRSKASTTHTFDITIDPIERPSTSCSTESAEMHSMA